MTTPPFAKGQRVSMTLKGIGMLQRGGRRSLWSTTGIVVWVGRAHLRVLRDGFKHPYPYPLELWE
jgi:hypothetical protein